MDDNLFSGIVAGGVIVGFMIILFILCFIGTRIDEKYEAEEARRLSLEVVAIQRPFGKSRHGSQSPLVKKCDPSVFTIGGDNPGFEQEANGGIHRSNGIIPSPVRHNNGHIIFSASEKTELNDLKNGTIINGIDSSKPRAKSMRESTTTTVTTNGVHSPPKFVKSHSVQGDYYSADVIVKETTFGVMVETVHSAKMNGNHNGISNNNLQSQLSANGAVSKVNSFENDPIIEEGYVAHDSPNKGLNNVAYNPDGKDNKGVPHCPRNTRRKYQTPYSNQMKDVLL